MNLADKLRLSIVNFLITHPKRALLLFLLLNIIIVPGLFQLKSDFTYKAWYNDSDPKVQAFQEFERTFGNDDNLIVIIHNKDGILNKKTLRIIDELTDALWKTSEIVRVDSLNNYQYTSVEGDDLLVEDLVESSFIDELDIGDINALRRRITSDPILTNYLISKDQKSTLIQAFVRPAIGKIPDQSAITHDVREKLDVFIKKYSEVDFYLSGQVTIVDDFKMATFSDMALLIPILYVFFTLLLYWKYRSIATILLTFGTITSASLLMMSAAGYAGQHLNTLTSAAPTILLTVALSDAVHIFSSYFFALSNKFNNASSLFYSLKKNFYPTLLTSLTTGIGFLSFYDAKVQPVAELGIIVFLGVIFAWLVAYFALAPTILLSSRAFSRFEIGNEKSREVESKIKPTPMSVTITNQIKRHRKSIIFATLIISILSGYYISKLKVNMDPVAQFQDSHPSVQASRFLEKNFDFSSTVELVIRADEPEGGKEPDFLNKIEKFIEWLEVQDKISKIVSVNNILKSVNKSLNYGDMNFYKIPDTRNKVAESLLLYSLGLPQGKDMNNLISLNNQELHLSTQWNHRDSNGALAKMDEIKKKAKELGLHLKITGKTPLFHELTPHVVNTFFHSFLVALIGITIVLIVSLKSFLLGILALIPNVFPLMLGGALYYFTGYDVDMGTVVVASVCLGIAVDDSIHFLFEYKKYRNHGHTSIEAIQTLLTSTYPALFMTTLLISVGFSSFVFGSYIPNIKFGLCVAGILIIALAADFIILPALVLCLDKKIK